MTYRGSCHCGGIRFRFESPAITAGVRCNCSICSRKGAVMSVPYFPPKDFVLESDSTLAVYRFGDRLVNHCFCKVCGVYPFHDGTERPGHYRVNLGCVEGIDPLALELKMIDGRSY